MMEFDQFNLFYYRVTPNKMETEMCHCFIIYESLLFFFVAMAIALELEHDLQNTAGSLLFSVTFPSTATSLYRPDLAKGLWGLLSVAAMAVSQCGNRVKRQNPLTPTSIARILRFY